MDWCTICYYDLLNDFTVLIIVSYYFSFVNIHVSSLSLSLFCFFWKNVVWLSSTFLTLDFGFFRTQMNRNGPRQMVTVPCWKHYTRHWMRWTLLWKLNALIVPRDTFWHIVMQVVRLNDCEIYSYYPDSDADPFPEKGAM